MISKPILRFCFAIILTAGISSNVLAQISISISDFPHAGMLVARTQDTTSSVLAGPAGPNQVWDFSNLVTSFIDSTLYMMPDGVPGSQNHPGANLVEKDMNASANFEGAFNYIYYDSQVDGWYNLGQELRITFWGFEFNYHMFVNPPSLILPLPCFYGLTNTMDFDWDTYSSGWYAGGQTDTSRVVSNMHVTQEADAWGTIITPEGSYDALRVHEHIKILDSIYEYNAGSWIFQDTSQSEWSDWRWYANGIGEVGFLRESGGKSGRGFTFFKSSTLVGLDESIENHELTLYPVPAHDKLYIESQKPINKVEVFDYYGNQLYIAFNSDPISLTDLPGGIYFLRAYSNGDVIVKKFIVR